MSENSPANRGLSGEPAKPIPPAEHQFKPGQSGNPGGRPKGKLTREIARVLRSLDPKTGEKVRVLLARAFVANAIKGKGAYAKEIIARLDGPTPREIKTQVSGSLTATVKVVEPTPAYMAEVLAILEQCEPRSGPANTPDAGEPAVVSAPAVRETSSIPCSDGA